MGVAGYGCEYSLVWIRAGVAGSAAMGGEL